MSKIDLIRFDLVYPMRFRGELSAELYSVRVQVHKDKYMYSTYLTACRSSHLEISYQTNRCCSCVAWFCLKQNKEVLQSTYLTGPLLDLPPRKST